MARLFVPLDVEYAADDKLAEAGPLAELLYIRALCFAKRNVKSDGEFSATQLAHFAVGIPLPKKHADALVGTGAWEATPKGWRIAGWLKHNKSGDEIATQQAIASELGIKGNHERWHIGPDGKPNAKCKLCQAEFKASRTPIGVRSGDPIGVASPETETEEETKKETETEPQQGGSGRVDDPPQRPLNPAAAAISILIEHDIAIGKALRPENYRRAMPEKYREQYRDDIAYYLKRRPDATAEEIAYYVLNVGDVVPQSDAREPWYANPACEACEGSGLVSEVDEKERTYYDACPCRQDDPYPDELAAVIPLDRKESA